MKSIRPYSIALALGAVLFVLAGCGKSSSVTSPASSLDTTPPAAPTNVTGAFDESSHRDYLTWTGSASADVAGYEVWQYTTDPALGGTGVLVGRTDAGASTFTVPLTRDDQQAWFRLRAQDEAGNISAYSQAAEHDLHGWDGLGGSNGDPIRDTGVN